MKKLVFLALVLAASGSIAADQAKKEWKNTTLSDATIKHIQQSKYTYMQCIAKEAQQKTYSKMDTRLATDKILNQCENYLADIRQVFKDEKVPPVIIERSMKQTRTQTARNVLREMMFADAARKSGQ